MRLLSKALLCVLGSLGLSANASAQAQLVRDLTPKGSTLGRSPYSRLIASTGTRFVFAAQSAAHGNEPWVSDGTFHGTKLLIDVAKGSASSSPADFLALGKRVLFITRTATAQAVWTTDGTVAGTKQIFTANWISALMPLDDRRAVIVTISNRRGLGHITDGTARGTKFWRACQCGFAFAPFTTREFLWWISGQTGQTIYASDGTSSRTLVKLGFGSTAPAWRSKGGIAWRGATYLAGLTSQGDRELFRISTSGKASLIKDLVPGRNEGFPGGFVAGATKFYFSASNGVWSSDGSTKGTVRIFPQSAQDLVVVGDRLFFSVDGKNGRGTELWTHDSAGARMVQDIRPGAQGSSPYDLTVAGNFIAFQADDGTHGRELWTLGSGAVIHDIGAGCGKGARVPKLSLTPLRIGQASVPQYSSLFPRSIGVLVMGLPGIDRPKDCLGRIDPSSRWIHEVWTQGNLTTRTGRRIRVPQQASLRGLRLAIQSAHLGTDAARGWDISNTLLAIIDL